MAAMRDYRRRLLPCAAFAKIPERDARFASLVGKIVLNACTGEDHQGNRQGFEQNIAALEGRCLPVPVPARPQGNLRHAPGIG